MRRGSSILTLAFTGVLALLCSPVSAQEYSQQHSGGQVDVGIFYDSLAPQGDWVEMPDYGWAWTPRVERGWRPYTRGQWVNTDDGWYWDSDERFGWATYHYGRWVDDPNYGWMWVPGTEWAPAWVSWRHGNGYTGWAPLPPRATWQTHVGLSIGGLDIDAFIGERDYSFVQDRSFVDRGVYQRVVPYAQNVTIINQTTNITNYTVVNQRVVNTGVPIANVERAVGRQVPRARTVDAARAGAPVHVRAGEVAVYRPEVRAVAPDRRPAQGKSLVKGEAPPPVLVARRKAIEQERKTKGNAPEVTAKDVQEKKANVAAQPPAKGQQDAAAQRAKAQEQQKIDAKAQADKRAMDAQDARTQQQTDQKQRSQQQLDQRAKAQDQQKANAQAQADKRAKDAKDARAQQQTDQKQRNQQQVDQRAKAQEQQKANAQAQADKRAKDAQDARAQQQTDQKQRNQQQVDQRAKVQEQQKANAQVQADKRAKDAEARAQQQGAQQQRNQQQVDQRAKAQEQQKANAQAQADKRAKDAQDARAQQQGAQQQRNQQQADQRAKAQDQQKANAQAQADKRAKDAQAAKDNNSKDKGKKPKSSPTPPPAGQPQ